MKLSVSMNEMLKDALCLHLSTPVWNDVWS